MRKKLLLYLPVCLLASSLILAQKDSTKKKNRVIAYAGIIVGGCDISIPVTVLAGVEKQLRPHLNISYDIHYMNTDYECTCDDRYSKGHYSSVIPSVKFYFNSGNKRDRGVIVGVGLGYIFAKDRGIEEEYTTDPATQKMTLSGNALPGKWDFNSICPSITYGVGFRLFKLPVTFSNIFYFAKTTEGWNAVAGGVGFKLGFRKL
jgi:hypothetical protein